MDPQADDVLRPQAYAAAYGDEQPSRPQPERILTPREIEQEIHILSEAFRRSAILVDGDRWDNPFYRLLSVHTLGLERLTALTLNTRVELIAMREMLASCIAAQTVFDGRLNAQLHALVPHLFMPPETATEDIAAHIHTQFPNVTPVFASDPEYQATIGMISNLQARVTELEATCLRLQETISRMTQDQYLGGREGMTDQQAERAKAKRPRDSSSPREFYGQELVQDQPTLSDATASLLGPGLRSHPHWRYNDLFNPFVPADPVANAEQPVPNPYVPIFEPDPYHDNRALEPEMFGPNTLPWQPVGAWQSGLSHIRYRRPDAAISHLETGEPRALDGPNLEVINYLLVRSIAIANPTQRLNRDPNDLNEDSSADISAGRIGPFAAAFQEDFAREITAALHQSLATGQGPSPSPSVHRASITEFNRQLRARALVIRRQEEARLSGLLSALRKR